MRITKMAWAVSGVMLAGLLAYAACAWTWMPERMPMQFDGGERATWTAPRGVFVVWYLAATLIAMAALGLAAWRSRRPGLAVVVALAGAGSLVLFHAIVQKVRPDPVLPISINLVVGLVMAMAVATAVLAWLMGRPSRPR